MLTSPMTKIVQRLHAATLAAGGGRPDEVLLNDFVRHHDADALTTLVRRHGPMVWGVCCRILHRQHDAEDAFQATFLVLVQKAASIANPAAVGNWLYGVAHQTAVRVRATNAKNARREHQVATMPDPPMPAVGDGGDLRHVLDTELARLPERYRVLIVLCDLEGRTRSEAAQLLDVPEGTAASRLTRARAMLGKRLVRRGMTTGAMTGVIPGMATAGVPPTLVASTIQMTTVIAAGGAGMVPATVSAVTQQVLFAMTMKKITTVALVLFAAVATGLGGLAVAQSKPEAKQAAEKRAVEEVKRAEGMSDQKPKLSVIRLGVKRDEIIAKYGQPSKTVTLASGIESLQFDHGSIRLLVEISPRTKQVIQIFYKKQTPFTTVQVSELLERNAEGSRWLPVSVSDESFWYDRLDGGSARGGKVGEDYQLAVLSGNELKGRNP